MVNTSRLAETVAQAFCVSMVEFLDQLFEAGFTKIGLRISLDVDRVSLLPSLLFCSFSNLFPIRSATKPEATV